MRRPKQFGGRRQDEEDTKSRQPICKTCINYRPKTSRQDAHCVYRNVYNPKPCDAFRYMWGWWWRNDEYKRNN